MKLGFGMSLLWLACGWAGYLLIKRDFRHKFGKWTEADREFFLIQATVAAPVTLVVGLMFLLISRLSSSRPGEDRDARW
jgi:hypothetical protein